jgi:Asp/Glu/hydantoin racemase
MRGDSLHALVNETEVVVITTNARLTPVISSAARNLLMNEISPNGRVTGVLRAPVLLNILRS